MTSVATHKYTRKVHFSETDAAGVVHFTCLPTYVEEAEHDYFRGCGVPPFEEGSGWPRIRLVIDYQSPCRFEDVIEITLEEFSATRSAISYRFVGKKLEPASVQVFQGEMTICYVRRTKEESSTSAMQKVLFSPAEIPCPILQALKISRKVN